MFPPMQAGTKRGQFVNVSDIVPTIYELVGRRPRPTSYRGIEQLPVTGHSFAAVLADAAAPATNTPAVLRDRAAAERSSPATGRRCASTTRAPTTTPSRGSCTTSPTTGRSATTSPPQEPEQLAELIDLWWQEAERHGVLPLDDRMFELFGARFRPNSPHPADRRYVYRPPMSPLPGQASAAIGGRAFDLTATVTRRAGDEGVLFATGTENSGLSMFVQNDRLVVDYNAFDDHTILESDVELPAGDVDTRRPVPPRWRDGGQHVRSRSTANRPARPTSRCSCG